MEYLLYPTIVVFVLVCLFLIALVLIQKGRGGGLSSAFGGAGGNTAFGSKTGDVLTWTTSIVFGVFLLLAIVLNLAANKENSRSLVPILQTPTAQPESGAAPTALDQILKQLPITAPTTQPQ